jgi:exosome complex exonuclease RRP6
MKEKHGRDYINTEKRDTPVIKRAATSTHTTKTYPNTTPETNMSTPNSEEEAFAKLQSTIQAALLATTRTTNAIVAQDLPFMRSLDPSAAAALDTQHARLLSLAERLLAHAAAGTDMVNPKLADADALETGWAGIVDVLDGLLERADTCLDGWEAGGGREPKTQDVQQMEGVEATSAASPAPAPMPKKAWEKVSRFLNITKPQKLFENPPKNDETGAFVPILSQKPWATVPLDKSLEKRNTYSVHTLTEQYAHPYQTEIENYRFPDSIYKNSKPIPYSDFESTSATFVDTPAALDEMLAELKKATEIAVDLEHHDWRSYIGIVSLMQISTRNRDWIVDTLKPWRRRLECLNEVFADPNIVKVFQGAHSDMIWLQRDFGLYIVGLFDTHHAARALSYPGASLAFLLSKFCSFDAQKQYQMADWRARPIPQAMLDYARSDTHFLLYIYDNMRNELIDSSQPNQPDGDLVKHVLQHSKQECLQRYENPIYDPVNGMGANGWYRQLVRTPALFTKEQFSVFRAIHGWRDSVARQEDESVMYIMTNHALLALAREIPLDRASLLQIGAPVSQPVRLRADELLAVIKKAKDEGAMGPEMRAIMDKIDQMQLDRKKKYWQERNANRPDQSKSAQSNGKGAIVTPPLPIVKRVAERLSQSRLWGAISSVFQNQQSQHYPEVELALPLPDLTAEIFEPNTLTPKQPAPLPHDHTFVQKQDRNVADGADDVFIVKQLGGRSKRKHGGQEDTIAGLEAPEPGQTGGDSLNSLDNVSIEGEAEAAAERARELKREKKARKKERTAAAMAAEQAEAGGEMSNNHEQQQPFDYAAQPSLLQGVQPEKGGKYKRPKKGKGPFDTYSRAADAPTGLGRTQKERGGKQATFSK